MLFHQKHGTREGRAIAQAASNAFRQGRAVGYAALGVAENAGARPRGADPRRAVGHIRKLTQIRNARRPDDEGFRVTRDGKCDYTGVRTRAIIDAQRLARHLEFQLFAAKTKLQRRSDQVGGR